MPLYGQTPAAVDQDFALPGLARLLADFCGVVVELADARLFFPDERADELTAALRRHWDTHA